jgi:hypothetical protein
MTLGYKRFQVIDLCAEPAFDRQVIVLESLPLPNAPVWHRQTGSRRLLHNVLAADLLVVWNWAGIGELQSPGQPKHLFQLKGKRRPGLLRAPAVLANTNGEHEHVATTEYPSYGLRRVC